MALLTFNPHEARTVTAIAERLFPADETGPGATAIGVLSYIDQALAGAYADHRRNLPAWPCRARPRGARPLRRALRRLRAGAAGRAAGRDGAWRSGRDARAVASGVLRAAARPHPGGAVRRPGCMAATATSSAGRCWATPASIWKTRLRRTCRRSRSRRAVSSSRWLTWA